MAIEDKAPKRPQQNTAGQETPMASAFAAASAGQQPFQGAADQQGAAAGGQGFSFLNPGASHRHAMGRTQASEALVKTAKALTTLLTEQIDKSFEITFIPLEKGQQALGISCLILAMRDSTNLEIGVAYHTLLLEASIEPPLPRFENIGGQNIEVMRVAGDADDDKLAKIVDETIFKHWPRSKMLFAGDCVVPRDFNLADENLLWRLANNAAFACSQQLAINRPGFVDLNLKNASKDSALMVRTTFDNPQSMNATGQPIRTDIVMSFSAAKQTTQFDNQQNVENVTALAHVGGFLDLVWDPQQAPPSTYVVYQQSQQPSFQRYAMRFVITALESAFELTLPCQLMALLPAISLREGNGWAQGLRGKEVIGGGLDMHDIGGIGIELNIENNPSGYGTRIDTKAAKFTPQERAALITAAIRQGLVLSLDIPECGPETWYNGTLAVAATGNPEANQTVIRAANQLTNNMFSKYFPADGQVAYDDQNRIHLGYYEDRQGLRRDIRDIDYLAILNLVGSQDPGVVRDWSDTYLKTNYPINQRLAARKRIISALFTNAVFTGFARRITFDPIFIEALVKGCNESGLAIRNVSPYADLGQYDRATAHFGAHQLMGADPTGIFNRGGFGQGATMGTSRAFGSRW